MPVKTDYERDFIFDIDAYLIDNYPSMTMAIRRSVCAMALEQLESYELEIFVDECVSEYSKTQLQLQKKEEEEEEE
jgi:hypothetical protein